MFSLSDLNKRESVLSLLKALHLQDEKYLMLENSKKSKIKNLINRIADSLKPGHGKSIKGFVLDKYSRLMIKYKVKAIIRDDKDIFYEDNEFFCDDRIAVYTAIFGDYESIHEPRIIPDNIDYYIITDCDKINKDSRWRVLEVELPSGLNSAQKNRYVKMHPHILFPNYRYSIYVDGSVQVLSDLTPLIHRIGKYGFAMHMHSSRDDLYDELIAAKYTKRITKENYKKYTKFFQEKKVPRHYGLLECGVIARNHESNTCLSMMEQWWENYLGGINRDQICLAYVLYENNIAVKEIGTLGTNMYKSCLFRVLMHK